MTAKKLQLGTDADEAKIADALTKLAEDILEGDAYCETYETAVHIDAQEAIEYELSLGITTSRGSRFTDVFDHHAIEDT